MSPIVSQAGWLYFIAVCRCGQSIMGRQRPATEANLRAALLDPYIAVSCKCVFACASVPLALKREIALSTRFGWKTLRKTCSHQSLVGRRCGRRRGRCEDPCVKRGRCCRLRERLRIIYFFHWSATSSAFRIGIFTSSTDVFQPNSVESTSSTTSSSQA